MKQRDGDAPPIPLSRRRLGIEAFRVEGCIQAEPVHAKWDGQWLVASRTLCDYAMVAIAVEAAFSGVDIGDGSSPEELMLAMVTCCDQIDVAEYQRYGRLHLICAST